MILKLRSVYQWLAVCLVLGSSQVQAFGADGHRIVVAIAKKKRSPVTAGERKGREGEKEGGERGLGRERRRERPGGEKQGGRGWKR